MSVSHTRHFAREWAVQFLFQLDLNEPEDLEEDRALFWESKTVEIEEEGPPVDFDKGRAFAEELVSGVLGQLEAIDARLGRYAEKWSVQRLAAVERNVLRLALYELFHREDVPPVVVLNEAIDLAKELSSDEAGRFVNGILDRALRDVERPLRGGPAKERRDG